jgi:hypothetical protein
MLDFPANPTLNQIFTAPNGTAWAWDGTKWTAAGVLGVPDAPANGITYGRNNNAWVDTSVRYRNRIINGDMSVDQRNGGNVVAMTGIMYVIDRWKYSGITGVGQCGQAASSPLPSKPYAYVIVWNTTTAHSIVAADNFSLYQMIEGNQFNDTMWGTANALPVTLEFYATASIAGTYSGVLRNGAHTRTYAFTYTITTASAWQKFRIAIPGDTVGTWSVAANAEAVDLLFDLGTGATYSTAPGVWTAGNFVAATGANGVVATLNASLYITGVALMVGAAAANAEPEFKKYSDNLVDCMRYFHKPNIALTLVSYAGFAGTSFYLNWQSPVVMRAAPTVISATWGSGGNANAGATTMLADNRTLQSSISSVAVGNASAILTLTALDADF